VSYGRHGRPRRPPHPERVDAQRLLVRVVRHGGGWVVLLVFTSLAMAGAQLLLPLTLGRVVDAALGAHDATVWLVWSIVLVAILIAADSLDDLAAGASTAHGTAWLRHTLLRHVLAVGTQAIRRFEAGDLTGRLVGNAAEAGRVAPVLVWTAADVLPAVGAVVALAVIDPWLATAFLIGLPVLVLLLRAFVRDASELADRYFQTQGTIAARMVDALAGARTIAASGTVDREVERVLAPLPELHRHGIGMWRAQTRISAQNALLVPLLEIAVLAVAGLQLSRGRITPGEMFAASQYVLLGLGVQSLVMTASRLVRARSAAGRTREVLAEPAMAYSDERLPHGDGRLEFRGVTVRPNGRRILDGIDLVVPGGALVAVVGRSGSGKSLLAALASRLLDPDAGEVLIDGVPLRRLAHGELRRAVGHGFERPVLVGETFADVIAFGVYSPSFGDLVAAARAAQADGFIRQLPDGYHTLAADAPMSGGEVQRVGLARAFSHAGRVLVLDDVAASLDTVTEHHISQVLTGSLTGRTRLVVAHRPTTTARADLVVWLDAGRVRATGTHRELWTDPAYRSVFAAPDPVEAGALA
jgi:ATP-binding cassette subfamily B protein